MTAPLPRSPEIMRPEETGLLVVDIQERLLVAQPTPERFVWNVKRLIAGAQALGVSIAVTEQYPEKLGSTAGPLARQLGFAPQDPSESTSEVNREEPSGLHRYRKEAFSCAECGELFALWRELGIERVLVCGMETHVCIQQTVLDLLADGYQVQVAVDGVSSRYAINHETGLRRMELSGVLLTTIEAALFEWCERAGTAQFKKISALVKETGPTK